VTSVNKSYNYGPSYNNIVIRGLTECSPISGNVIEGDSGGPVYRTYSSNYAACGIIAARSLLDTTWAYCPLIHVDGQFSVLTYTPN